MSISVLIPVHGEVLFLRESLESIWNQNCSETISIIIVIDRFANIPTELLDESNKYYQTSLIKSKGEGISAALNTGIDFSEDEFIARLDADDRMLPERIAKQLKAFHENPNLVLCGTGAYLISRDGQRIGESRNPETHNAILEELTRRTAFCHPSVMFRKTACVMAGYYDSTYDSAEDYELWTRIVKIGESRNLQDLLLEYRLHEKQISNLKSVEQSILATQIASLYAENNPNLRMRNSVLLPEVNLNNPSAYHVLLRYMREENMSKRNAKIRMCIFHPLLAIRIAYQKITF